MRVYILYCKEMSFSCTYDTMESLMEDIKLAIEQDATITLTIEPVEMSQKEYDELPESGGW